MKKGKRGFTLVEVAIFLAITGALFVGITVGVQNSVYQQRRNDSVQSFIEFLRSVYSGVENVQNAQEKGRSEKAIYGKLVTFGENKDSVGGSGKDKIFVYTVVGDAWMPESDDILTALAELRANVVNDEGNLVGYPETYIPKWGATINPACTESGCDYTPLKAALLVVRHPRSGVVYTYYMSGKTINVNEMMLGAYGGAINPLLSGGGVNYLTDGSFQLRKVDFCVNPEARSDAKDRTNVRIVLGARNASGVEQAPDYEEKCGASY